MNYALRCVAAGLLLAGAGSAAAQPEAIRGQVEQRVRLTARLIADSPTAQRILASGDADAISHFDEGRLHQALAEDRLAAGDLVGAGRAVDEALRHVGMARRMVPDARVRQAAARQRYEQLQPSVARLLEAGRRRIGSAGAADTDLLRAQSHLDDAQGAQQQGRYEDANQSLAAAESHLLAAMNRLLHASTLDYTERASTPAEEWALELARHQGLAALVPIALDQLKPAAEASALVERYQETSRALRAQAIQSATRGNTGQALELIRNASLYLQRALAAAGVLSPPPIGSNS